MQQFPRWLLPVHAKSHKHLAQKTWNLSEIIGESKEGDGGARLNDSTKHLLKKAAWRCCTTTRVEKNKGNRYACCYCEGPCLFFWSCLLPQWAVADILKDSRQVNATRTVAPSNPRKHPPCSWIVLNHFSSIANHKWQWRRADGYFASTPSANHYQSSWQTRC